MHRDRSDVSAACWSSRPAWPWSLAAGAAPRRGAGASRRRRSRAAPRPRRRRSEPRAAGSVAVDFSGINGRTLLMGGLVVCALGLLFGLMTFTQLKNLPVHASMLEVSELIYETCKTYLITQGKFILILEVVHRRRSWSFYFGVLRALRAVQGRHHPALQPDRHRRQLRRRLVRHPRQHVRQLAHGVRQPARQAVPDLRDPAQAGMSIGMLLISVELLLMLCILLFIPGDYAGPCFIGFAIGESLGAAALRIAGGIFTKIADIGSDLMKIVFNIKEDDARNPGVIADCTATTPATRSARAPTASRPTASPASR